MKIFEKFKNDWTVQAKTSGIQNFDSMNEFVNYLSTIRTEYEFGKLEIRFDVNLSVEI